MSFRTALGLVAASGALALGGSGCGIVLGLGDFSEGKGTPTGSGGAGGSGGGSSSTATATGTGGSGGSGDPCKDGKKDGNETDKDCGGACLPCADGLGCGNASDCTSHVCVGGSCHAPTCMDLVKNGAETDVDCGGGTCGACADGLGCGGPSDCKSGLCQGGKCFMGSCGDMVKNGTETDIDCGGSCPGCAPTLNCSVAADCASGICTAGKCVDGFLWNKHFGDADYQAGLGVSVDSGGSITLLGEFMGTINLGGGPMTNPCMDDPQTPEPDCAPFENFLARFDGTGKHVWSKHFDNVSDAFFNYEGITFTVSGTGDTWILSYGDGSLDFGAGQLPDPSPCGPGCDVDTTLVRLDSNGVYQWGKRYGDSSNDQLGKAIAAGPGGAIAVGGEFTGTINFGGGVLTSAGSYDAFVAKLDSTGNQIWAKRYGEATNVQDVRSVAFDAAGNVFVGGVFAVGIDFGTGNLPSAGAQDLFLAKLSSATGGTLWAKRFGDVQDQAGTYDTFRTATDPAGNVFFAGPLHSSADFGGGALTAVGTDIFIAKLDLNGKHLWSKRVGNAQLSDLTVNGAGAVILTGTSVGGDTDFGGGPLANGFLAKLDANGAHVWSKPFAGRSVAVGSKALLLTGTLVGTQDFGGGPLVSAGDADAFLLKLIDP